MMTGYVLTGSTVATCPHGGQVTLTPGQNQMKAAGSPTLLITDQATIAGCAFAIGNVPSPCLTVRWLPPTAALRVAVHGTPVLLSTTVGLCLSGTSLPQGPVLFTSYQQRVRAQ